MDSKIWSHTDNCRNCGQELTGKYCSNCGQKANTRRYGASLISKDIAKEKLYAKSKHFRTLYRLFISPGKFARDYLNGKRNPFTAPFTFYLFILGIYVILFHNFSDIILPFDENDQKYNELIVIVNQNLNYFSFLMPVTYAFSYFIFYRRKTGINFPESLVVSLYFLGTTLVIGIVFMLLMYFDSFFWSLRTFVIAAYIFYAYYQFAGIKGFRGIFLTIVSTSMGFILAVLVIVVFSLLFIY